ncbi:MAG: pteridine reductase [Candidatus Competibacteraceae bacterium]|jgi:pteridine reductase|nr:pteridine reductase [Candidatus Competibacteraceae bacterium]
MDSIINKTVLITGGAQRIGAVIARTLHQAGMNIALHYRSSQQAAETLSAELNAQRPDSVLLLQADLQDAGHLAALVEQAATRWHGLDLLVNNASSFYPTPLGSATEAQWDDLFASNLKAPFFLAQAAAPYLHKQQGNIINMADIHAQRPMRQHTIYCAAKAGLVMLTQSLARELAPSVRVNAIAPGAILWPEHEANNTTQATILSRIALQRAGNPEDIAQTVLFLIRDGGYITGQVIAVDGGRTLFI